MNFPARCGALHAINRHGPPPTVPVMLVGDMYSAAGIPAVLLDIGRSRHGQVVVASVVDAFHNLVMSIHHRRASDDWRAERRTNYLSSGTPSYETYWCTYGRYVVVDAVERRSFDNPLAFLQIDFSAERDHFDRERWPRPHEALTARLLQRPRDTWATLFATCDCCAEPMLSFDEAVDDLQLIARRTFSDVAGIYHPSPAIRFGRVPCGVPTQTPRVAEGAATASQIVNWLA